MEEEECIRLTKKDEKYFKVEGYDFHKEHSPGFIIGEEFDRGDYASKIKTIILKNNFGGSWKFFIEEYLRNIKNEAPNNAVAFLEHDCIDIPPGPYGQFEHPTHKSFVIEYFIEQKDQNKN